MDETRRFRTAAAHYLAGRSPYPDALIRRVAQLTALEPGHRAMDLGCGPAQLARAFAPLVHDVAAIDPEPEMLRVARAATTETNIAFHLASSADLGPQFGRFRLVAMGRSFHWMDRPETLRRLDALIEPGGAIALFHDTHPQIPDNAWYPAYRALLRRYAGDDSYGAQTSRADWVRHEAILLDSAFAHVEEIGVHQRRPASVAALIDRALSMSSTSGARLGDQADTMMDDIRATLPPGDFVEVVVSQATLAWRP